MYVTSDATVTNTAGEILCEPDVEEAHEERSALQFTTMIIQSILQQWDITYDPALRRAFAR